MRRAAGSARRARSCSPSDCSRRSSDPRLHTRRHRPAHRRRRRTSPAPRARCSTRSCCWRASRRCRSSLQAALAGADGSETVTLGAELGAPFRAYSRPGMHSLERLRARRARAAGERRRARRLARGRQGSRRRPPARTRPCSRSARTPPSPASWRGASRPSPASSTACAAAIARACDTLAAGNPLAEGAGVAQVAPHPLPARPGSDDAGQRPRRVRRGGRRRRRACRSSRSR